MGRFNFIVIEPDGGTSSGVIEAADRASAADALSASGKLPIRLVPAGARETEAPSRHQKRLKDEPLSRACRGLGLLLRAGASLDEAIGIQARQATGAEATALRDILEEVKAGGALSAALSGRAPAFVNGLIEAGETGGALAAALIRAAELLEERQRLRAKIRSSLIYPGLVLCLTVLAVLFLAFAVLPQFEALFRGFNQELPWLTAVFLRAGAVVRETWWMAAGLLIAIAVCVRAALATDGGRRAVHGGLLKVPMLGAALRGIETARFCRTLALLLESGAPMLSALRLAARTVENRVLAEWLTDAVDAVREGGRLSRALRESQALSQSTVDMIRVGEDSGALVEMLAHVAALNQTDAERMLGRMVESLTPVLTLVLGGLIAALMAGIITAVFSLNAIAV